MPSPKVEPTMNFFTALKAVLNGKIITKLEWDNTEIYGLLRNAQLQLHKPDGFHVWIISEGDMLGEDWVIINNPIDPTLVLN